MKATAIKRIEIHGLWGRRSISWTLNPDVNILSGINGIGKSTILNLALRAMRGEPLPSAGCSINITFEPKEATSIDYDLIRSFDRPLMRSDMLDKLSDHTVLTEVDWQLYELQRRYLNYQVNIGNRMIQLLQSSDPKASEEATSLTWPKKSFQDIMEELFFDTKKKIDRQSNEIIFEQAGDRLRPYQLSSGEKQILMILLTALVQDGQPVALFMDEPEVSLHIEWQQKLIGLIRELNPQAQIILTTHSPAVIMNGWMDAVTEVSDISVDPLLD